MLGAENITDPTGFVTLCQKAIPDEREPSNFQIYMRAEHIAIEV